MFGSYVNFLEKSKLKLFLTFSLCFLVGEDARICKFSSFNYVDILYQNDQDIKNYNTLVYIYFRDNLDTVFLQFLIQYVTFTEKNKIYSLK